jgi:hypothetical protein
MFGPEVGSSPDSGRQERSRGDAAFTSAWEAGHAVSEDSALAEAQAIGQAERNQRPAGLIRGEVEVLCWLARALVSSVGKALEVVGGSGLFRTWDSSGLFVTFTVCSSTHSRPNASSS